MKTTAMYALTCLFALLTGPVGVARAQLEVEPDEQNVVASRLIGSWQADAELCERLGSDGQQEFGNIGDNVLTFTEDATVAGLIPERFERPLKEYQIYLAGTMSFGDESFPFVLLSIRGNPHLLIFREQNGNAFGDSESMNVMLAYAEEPANDLLFLGGDFIGQPFAAYGRVEQAQDADEDQNQE